MIDRRWGHIGRVGELLLRELALVPQVTERCHALSFYCVDDMVSQMIRRATIVLRTSQFVKSSTRLPQGERRMTATR